MDVIAMFEQLNDEGKARAYDFALALLEMQNQQIDTTPKQ